MGEKVAYTFFALILLFLAVKNAPAVNNFLNHLGNAFGTQVATLQGSQYTG